MNAPVHGARTPIFDLLKTREPVAAQGDLIDFSKLFGTLWRGRFRVLAAMLFAALLGGLWAAFVAVPQYRATTVLIMAPDTVIATGLEGVVPGLTGDSVAVNTEVEILKSRALLRMLGDELGLVRDPEFNPALRPPTLTGALWQGLTGMPGGQGAPAPDGLALAETLDALEARIAVRSIPDSRVFEVTAESGDPAKAAAIANALARIYLGEQIALKQRDATRATDWLIDRVAELRVQLEATDSRARRFAAEMDLISPEALEALAVQLGDIRRRITARRADLARNGASTAHTRKQIEPMLAMEADLSRQLAQHSQGLVELGQLQLEAEASRLIYEHFLGRLKEASVQRGIQKADSRILSQAEVPVIAAWPQPLLITVLCAFLGAVLATAQLVSKEARTTVLRSVEELEAATGRPVLGMAPRLAGRTVRSAAQRLAASPGSFAAESIRSLRTALFLSAATPPQVVMITSSGPGEGKSTLAGALGKSLADLQKKVLVIEADIRRRSVRRLRPGSAGPGLLAVLDGSCSLRKAVRRPKGQSFDTLSAEAVRATAADLFSSRQIDTLVKTARQSYDVIVIVAPPILAVPDARLLGKTADGVIYAVAWNRAGARQVRAGLRALDTALLPLAGLVLTEVDAKGLARFGDDGGIAAFRASGYYES